MQRTVFISLFLLLSLSALAQEFGNYQYSISKQDQTAANRLAIAPFPAQAGNPNGAYQDIDIRVLYNAKPDQYLAILNVIQLAPTPEEANRLLSQRVQGTIKALEKHGISQEDVQVDVISQVAIYEYDVEKKLFSKRYQEKPSGFEIQKNLHIRYDQPAQLEAILTAAAEQEIYELTKVSYQLKDNQAIYQQMRTKAIAALKAQEAVYKEMNIELDTLSRSFSEATSAHQPASLYGTYAGASVSCLTEKVKDANQVKNLRKPQRHFFKGIPPEGYQVVINPMPMGPVVQFTYHLKVRYLFQTPKPIVQTKTKKQVMILTTDGKLVPIPGNE